MLPLQLNRLKLPKRFSFLCQLLVLSLVMHVIVLLFLFFYGGHQKRLILAASLPQEKSIVLMPLIKRIAKKGTTGLKKYTQHTTASINAPKTATVADNSSKASKKTVSKRQSKSVVCDKKNQKKNGVTKKEKPPLKKKSEEVAKTKPLKKQSPEKIISEPHPEEVKKPLDHIAPVQSTTNDLLNSSHDLQMTGTTMVLGWEDLQELRMVTRLKEEITGLWKRPAGLPPSLVYKALIYVDKQGNVQIKKEEPTSSLALNITARGFITGFKFPHDVWGYEIELIL